MKTFSSADEDPNVDYAVNQVLLNMELSQPGTDEYTTMVDNVTKLMKAKTDAQNAQPESWIRTNSGTLLLIGANLAGILLVMHHEKLDIFTTKAFGLIPRALK